MRHIIALISLSTFGCGPEQPPASTPLALELLGCVDEGHPKQTCAEFCEWDDAVCAEDACDGMTVQSFPFPVYCLERDSSKSTEITLGCDDEFVFDENHAYYNCCCDYR